MWTGYHRRSRSKKSWKCDASQIAYSIITEVEPPKRQDPYPDRQIDCQEALEPHFQKLMEKMFAHGWASGETRKAFFQLVAAHRRAEEETAKFDTELALLRAMGKARP